MPLAADGDIRVAIAAVGGRPSTTWQAGHVPPHRSPCVPDGLLRQCTLSAGACRHRRTEHLAEPVVQVGVGEVRGGHVSEVAALGLLALDRFEQRLEVADAEAARALALDDLEEDRRAVLDRRVKIWRR